MIKENHEKSCESCRYYSQHYSKQGKSFKIVFCGKCLKHHNRIKCKIPSEFCDLWEDFAFKKEERRKAIKEVLRNISDRLDEIAVILKDDVE